MQTEHIPLFREAAETIYELLQNDTFYKQCEARQNYLDRQRETFACIDQASDRRYKAEKEADHIQSKLSTLNMFISTEEKTLANLRAALADLRAQQ